MKQEHIQPLTEVKNGKVLPQTCLRKLNLLIAQSKQRKKIPLNVIGLNKNGKSVLCNELLNLKFQNQYQEITQQDQGMSATYEYLFPSETDPMTAAKVHFQTNSILSKDQLKYAQILKNKTLQQQKLSKNFQFLYSSIQQSSFQQYKQRFQNKKMNSQTMIQLKQRHTKERERLLVVKEKKMLMGQNLSKEQFEDRLKNIQTQNLNQMNLNCYLNSSSEILNNELISHYISVIDHPGINQNFNQSQQQNIKKDKKQQDKKQQHKKQPIQKQHEEKYVIQISTQLKFHQSQIIVYCSSRNTGLFNKDHRRNIRKLLEQNDSDRLIFAFCFIGSIRQDKPLVSQIQIYKNMFYLIPTQMERITTQILSQAKEKQKFRSILGEQKINKISKMQKMLKTYLMQIQQLFKIYEVKAINKAQSPQQKSQRKIKQFYKNQERIGHFLTLLPFNWFHFYGLNQQPISYKLVMLQKIDKFCHKNFQFLIKNKAKKIFQQSYKEIKQFFFKLKQIISFQNQITKLSQEQKQEIQSCYQKIKQALQKFKEAYQVIQKEYLLKQKLEIQMINKKFSQLIDDGYIKELQQKFKSKKLLQNQIKQSLQTTFDQATNQISRQLLNIKIKISNFDPKKLLNQKPQQESSPLNIILQGMFLIFHKMLSFVRTQSKLGEIIQTIYLNCKYFVKQIIQEDISKKIFQWNNFLSKSEQLYAPLNLTIKFNTLIQQNAQVLDNVSNNFWFNMCKVVYEGKNMITLNLCKNQNQFEFQQIIKKFKSIVQFNLKQINIINWSQFDSSKLDEKAMNQNIYKQEAETSMEKNQKQFFKNQTLKKLKHIQYVQKFASKVQSIWLQKEKNEKILYFQQKNQEQQN